MMHRARVHITGRVQGVGFRHATRKQAQSLSLNGWVRNRSDGSVEAEFEGPKDAVQEMIDWCRNGPAFAKVDQVDANAEEAKSAKHQGFHVRG